MNISKHTSRILAGLAAIIFLSACEMALPMSEVIKTPGIYECVPKKDRRKTYRFDSHAPTSLVLRGSRSGIEFEDLNSGQTIRFYDRSINPYYCRKTGESKFLQVA